jgi:endoglucanase
LLTIVPFDGYPENVWDDDMELGATELYFALESAQSGSKSGARFLPVGLAHTDPMVYLRQAAQFARNYITDVYDAGYTDTLNLYDVSGLAHFELYRALKMAGNPGGLAISEGGIRGQFLRQVDDAIAQAASDPWGFGYQWSYGDTTSHGAGLSVMASEAYYVTQAKKYDTYSQRWLANILGVNSWGTSFIVGDGSTFPNCIQHQVANLAGALDGSSGGTPVLWGAVTEGPSSYATSGVVGGMNLCPADGVDTFRKFNGNAGVFDRSLTAVYRDNVQSYSTTEPAIDLTATSFLMWAWRMGQRPGF